MSEGTPLKSGPPAKKKGTKRGTGQGGSKSNKQSGPQRLQRVLASAGFGSRRQCEELIVEGRVEVDGKLVDQLGTQVDPKKSEIFVDGTPVRPEKHVYFIVNKPPGVVTTNRDPQGRTRVVDLIQERERVFPVGRLDRNSEGLLLLTNDGDFAQQLAHPKFGVRKIYRVTVAGKIDNATIAKMRKGIHIAEGRVHVDGAKILRHRAKSTDLEILLREGKNREIRRILARMGHKVLSLQRIAIGPLRLGELPRGAYRALTATELRRLRDEIFYQSKRPRDADQEPPSTPRQTKKRGGKSKPTQGRAGKRPSRSKPPTEDLDFLGSEWSGAVSSDASSSQESSNRILVDSSVADTSSRRGTIIGSVDSSSDEPARKKRAAKKTTKPSAKGTSKRSAKGARRTGKSTGNAGASNTDTRGARGTKKKSGSRPGTKRSTKKGTSSRKAGGSRSVKGKGRAAPRAGIKRSAKRKRRPS